MGKGPNDPRFCIVLLVALACGLTLESQGTPPVTYEAYAVRFGTLPQFRVAGLIAGADAADGSTFP